VKRALITGGAGFIGFHLARRLAETGYEVDIVDNLARGAVDSDFSRLLEATSTRLYTVDLLEAGGLASLDRSYTHVVHLAAIVGVRNVVANPVPTLVDNVVIARNVLDWAQANPKLERFLFLSTSEVYGGAQAAGILPIPTPEDILLTLPRLEEARTSYALSKIAGEALCHYGGVPFTILRPHNVYGPRMGLDHVVPELLQRAHAAPEGGTLEVYSVEHRRTFCFVDDAVEIIRLVLEEPNAAGKTLNLGAADPEVTMGELGERVARTVGKHLDVVALAPTPGSPARRRPDTAAARALTGFEPRVSLDDGLEQTYAWYRENVFERAKTEDRAQAQAPEG
jgi:UDP-glucose 4-epimerase